MQGKKHKELRGTNKPMAKTVAVDPDQAVLTVPETAAMLRISTWTVWTQIKKGNLKPLRLGDRVLFSRVYLERLLAQE